MEVCRQKTNVILKLLCEGWTNVVLLHHIQYIQYCRWHFNFMLKSQFSASHLNFASSLSQGHKIIFYSDRFLMPTNHQAFYKIEFSFTYYFYYYLLLVYTRNLRHKILSQCPWVRLQIRTSNPIRPSPVSRLKEIVSRDFLLLF